MRKEHVKVEQWQTGGFAVRRKVRCRCGVVLEHYNRGHLNDLFRLHQASPELNQEELEEASRRKA